MLNDLQEINSAIILKNYLRETLDSSTDVFYLKDKKNPMMRDKIKERELNSLVKELESDILESSVNVLKQMKLEANIDLAREVAKKQEELKAQIGAEINKNVTPTMPVVDLAQKDLKKNSFKRVADEKENE